MVPILRISKHTWCQIHASLHIVIDVMTPANFWSVVNCLVGFHDTE